MRNSDFAVSRSLSILYLPSTVYKLTWFIHVYALYMRVYMYEQVVNFHYLHYNNLRTNKHCMYFVYPLIIWYLFSLIVRKEICV